jgi:hypothetical protein
MQRLDEALLQEFAPQGVIRAEFVIAFSEPFGFWAWLGTETDAQRDALASDPTTEQRVCDLASGHGVGPLYKGFTVESQQTVDREYEGSWFYRLR